MSRKVIQLYTIKEILKVNNNKITIDEGGNFVHAQGSYVFFNDYFYLLGQTIHVDDQYYWNSEQPVESWMIKKDFSEEL